MFKPVNPKPDFPKMERRILKWWYKEGVVKEYLLKNRDSPKRFSFLDGPITANNPMGVHHAWGRTYKDLWQRYFNMRGYNQRFQNGFDCQGLWVEVEVEKELGFKSKRDIEKYGVANFVKKCIERVKKYAKIQTEQSKRLGYFMDWDNSYYTLSEENNYMIWHFLKKCHQNGWLYKGEDVVPWCDRCGTAISQHEILTTDYKEITHKALFLKFPIIGREKEYLLVWTTTPWTLPANVALAVHPEKEYVKIRSKNAKSKTTLILAKACLKIIREKYEIVEEFLGKKLVGLNYSGPFDDFPIWKKQKAVHQLVSWKEVKEEEGTGLVHVSTGSGPEDYDLGKDLNLPIFPVLDEFGRYVQGFSFLEGKKARQVNDLIIKQLKKKGFLYYSHDFAHRYPICWRCGQELVFALVDEWYIAMDKKEEKSKTLREQMIEVAKKIHWIPQWGLESELDWLKNMEDWLISKKRYWGLALPIWECKKCGHFEVIGSKEELKKKAIEGWEKFAGHSPHRPWIDEVKIKCPKCGEVISRILDVGNPWLDAGIVPFSTLIDPKTGKLSYTHDKRYWRKWFPADFITESFPGQFKNWFYSLIAMSTVLEKKNPFKVVLGFATLLAEDGRPMHKSLGNAIEFNEGADKIGVDVMRWMYLTANPFENLLFGYKRADEVRRRFHLPLWNVYNFFISYANLDKIKDLKTKKESKNILDQWILSRLNQTIRIVTRSLDNFDVFTASHAASYFVSDLSTWYLRRSRQRAGPAAINEKDKNAFYQTLYQVLIIISKLLAPFIPFMTEEIFKNLTKKRSVHLEDWPVAKKNLINKKLEGQMEMVRKICELGHAERKRLKIKVRQPLAKLKIKNSKFKITIKNKKLLKEYEKIIKDELNVKEIEWMEGKGMLRVAFDTKITPELKAEGEARELVRRVQILRKKIGCNLDEKIVIYSPFWPKEFEEYIKNKTLAKEILWGKYLKISTS